MASDLQPHLQDKIFEVRLEPNDTPSKITSYFPLSDYEKQEIISALPSNPIEFRSIFSDTITDEQWSMTKDQIKKSLTMNSFLLTVSNLDFIMEKILANVPG